ncbi:hypothetical protein Leryth_001890 [Lithospermum erythrorhizon]|nr:hypothetical protein Leryth_001890 [Lithospermum erythrorhizon]
MMIIDERGHTKPILVKFGVVVALSLGGIIYSYSRANKIKPSKSFQASLDTCEKTDSGRTRNDNHALYNSSSRPEKHEESPSDTCSPCTGSNGEKDGYIWPEFKEHKCTEKDGNIYEREIRSLRNMVKVLKERERDLEIELLEYYGLKEQEKAAMDLQNTLEINNMEAKLFRLKIKSLEGDKKRLEEQVADHAKVSAAFEKAKAKIKLLKNKLRSEAEQNRDQILALQARVLNFRENEEDIAAHQEDIHAKLQHIKDLEKEVEDLKDVNNSLRLENSELAQKLDFVQCIAATTVLNDDEKEAAKKECKRLKQETKELSKEIERLQSEHSIDKEELLHLRWLSTCFRHELKKQRSLPVEPVSKELNTTESPGSEEKSNSDQQDSWITDSGEGSSPIDLSSATPTHRLKKKVINKFMRLLRGKRRNNQFRRSSSGDTSISIEDTMGRIPSPESRSSTDVGPDGLYDSSRSSSRGSRFSSMN